jgi:putative ABC transport system permease protein
VLGKTVVDNLFNGDDPVGKIIRVKGVPFTVVGMLAPKGQSVSGQDQDDIIVVPLSTAKKKVIGSSQANAQSVQQIMVQGRDGMTKMAEEQVKTLLRQRHRLPSERGRRFQRTQYGGNIRGAGELGAGDVDSAGVDRERIAHRGRDRHHEHHAGVGDRATKEIGLRQAVGAKTKDILAQFLVEAVTLSVLGGGLGILMGVTGQPADLVFRGVEYGGEHGIDRAGVRVFGAGGCVLRVLSGSEGGVFGSHRGFEIRVKNGR